MRKTICIITAGILILTALSGCSMFKKTAVEDMDELCPASSIVMGEDEAMKLNDKVQIHLYFSDGEGTKLQKEIRYIDAKEAKKSVNNLASVIVKELIKGPSEKSGLKPTVAKEAQLVRPVQIEARVATVDLTKEFVEKHPGGKEAAQLTIYSIVNSLTELKEIEKVEFRIDGKEVQDFKDSFKFDDPFPRDTKLIDKNVEAISSSVAEGTSDEESEDKDKEESKEKKE